MRDGACMKVHVVCTYRMNAAAAPFEADQTSTGLRFLELLHSKCIFVASLVFLPFLSPFSSPPQQPS